MRKSAYKYEKRGFTPLEKATDFSRWSLPIEGDGGLKPPSPQTVRERSSLTGFTLLELMIACAVLIIALTGVLATFVACLDLAETTKNSNLALGAAQAEAEQMRRADFLSLYTTYNGHTFNVSTMGANQSLGTTTIDNSNPALLKIDIGVCWRQRGARVIGECTYDGSKVVFSDANGNGILDSPAQITTYMAQR